MTTASELGLAPGAQALRRLIDQAFAPSSVVHQRSGTQNLTRMKENSGFTNWETERMLQRALVHFGLGGAQQETHAITPYLLSFERFVGVLRRYEIDELHGGAARERGEVRRQAVGQNQQHRHAGRLGGLNREREDDPVVTSEVFLDLHPIEVGDPHFKEFATCQNSASVNPVALRKYGTPGPATCGFDIVPGSIHINQRALVGELVS
jgi:hypothetical protein